MHSVFIKLLGAFSAAFIVILIALMALRFLTAASPNMEISIDKARDYVQYLVYEIGNPPDLDKARDISASAGISIVITGPDLKWSSHGIYFNDEDDFPYFFPDWLDRQIVIESGNYSFRFSEFHSDLPLSLAFWIIMGSAVVVALLATYFMVRHLLKPLREMYGVALELGRANWKERVHPKGNDEFAVLGKALNSMADQIERHILSMHDLLGAISHELRSPLTRMKVALEFINDKSISESLSEEIDVLDRLTGDLLEQRRLAEGQGFLNREDLSLHSWLDGLSKSYLLEGFPLTIRKEGPDRLVRLDRSRMELAVRNLLENARKYASDSPVDLTVHSNGADGGFYLEVADRGPGVPEAMLVRLGEPFLLGDRSRSGRRDSGGFGLGLSIVKAVAEAHGAVFLPENRAGGGFSLRLVFPES